MKEHNLLIIHQIIEDYTSFKKLHISKIVDELNSILQYFDAFKKVRIEISFSDSKEILEDFSDKGILIDEKNKKTSYLLNSLRYFEIGETMHSFLISNLLNPAAEHGQGKLFLNSFLSMIGIETTENDLWVVTSESRRIDILIKRKYPHSVVIIENKSNYAGDQENQLYRYWFQEMFQPNDDKACDYTLKNKKYYKIVYLSPNDKKIPDTNSLMRPNWEWLSKKYPELPCKLKDSDIQKINFNTHIVEWLQSCLIHLKENHRLREYIMQYIELWK
ncbi:MAG: PD-(D/E)XK nuclease family protein [Bacteroidota bacterium]|nr:PD-(D/E)XK nuclease family protein [Bacteroidota bacterium]